MHAQSVARRSLLSCLGLCLLGSVAWVGCGGGSDSGAGPFPDGGWDTSAPDAELPETEAGWDAPPEADASDEDAGSEDGASGACALNEVPLLTLSYGGSERYFVEVDIEGDAKALQFDTGSSITFMFTGAGSPDYEPDIAVVGIGCETLSVAGRGYDADGTSVQGLEVVGLLGMDFLIQRPSLLEIDARLVSRYQTLPDELLQVPGAFPISYDDVYGHALVPLMLDGQPVRLMFDTGGGDTLLVGVEGRPGDVESYVQDFEGNVFPIYTGTGDITFPGGQSRTVVVARAPEFPYFEQTVAALGGNLHGLLGVTAFPNERLLFDGKNLEFWALPVQ